MNSSKKTFNFLNNRALKICFFGIVAVVAFMLGSWLVARGYRESWLGHAALIGVIAMLFFVAVGELASSIGKFSATGYVIVTFFAAFTCYVISPVWQALNVLDISNFDNFLEVVNGGNIGFAFLYGVVYILTLLLGFVIHRKNILVKKET